MRRCGLVCVVVFAAVVPVCGQQVAPYDSQKVTTPFHSPEAALAMMEMPPGFHATVFAAEPHLRQPIGFTTDERGRLWVVENDTYADGQRNYDTRLRDRIVILEDVDHDGAFDKRTVFWDQGVRMTSVEVGFGGVWVLAAPQMLFIPDADGDDIPDGPPQVLLDGWDDDVIRHNIVNGLRWGPDGWLYGRHGIQATSLVGKPGETASQRTRVTCGIWRFHPTRREFEMVAAGGTNPWGFDFNRHGEMFMSNTVIGHLWHVVPGAYYRRMYGSHFNPYVYEIIEQTADHFHWDTGDEAWNDAKKGELSDGTDAAGGGHAHCGLMIYQGDNWPKKYRDSALMLNFHGRRVNQDFLMRRGNGYVGTHGPDLFRTEDVWFRGIEMQYGPDGAVYLLDWSDIGECHENDGVHRSSGRIYRIHYGELQPPTHRDLRSLSNTDLVGLQWHSNEWYVRKSRRLLMERAARGVNMDDAIAALLTERGEKSPEHVLRTMWCLYCIGYQEESWFLGQLNHPSEHVRAWAIRLLIDRHGEVPRTVCDRLAYHAEFEKSGVVRLYLASALNRLPLDRRFEVAIDLVHYAEDAEDRQQPLMIWYGIEPAVPAYPKQAVNLAVSSQLPQVRRLIARRLTAGLADARMSAPLIRALRDSPVAVQVDLLKGMSESLKGVRRTDPPAGWSDFAAVAGRQPATRNLVRELSVVFGDGRALDDVRRIARDRGAADDARRAAIEVLAAARPDDLFDVLKPLVNDRVAAGAAVRALAQSDHPQVADVVLSQYHRLAPGDKAAAIDTLVARVTNARRLLEAVRSGQVERTALSAFHARQIQSFEEPEVTAALTDIWGEIRETSAERKAAIERLRGMLETSADASPARGRKVFADSCANCHVLFGEGGNIGPDLTGSNRRNLSYLLENIVDPSASVAASFRMSTLVLEDGRTLNGVVVQEDDTTVTVQTEKQKLQIPRGDISIRKPTTQSLMPEGLLKNLNEQQIRDLFAYLSAPRQVRIP